MCTTYWIPFPTLAFMGHPFFWVMVGSRERLHQAPFLTFLCVVKSHPPPHIHTCTGAVIGTSESFQLQAGLRSHNPHEKFICCICCVSFHPMCPGFDSMSYTQQVLSGCLLGENVLMTNVSRRTPVSRRMPVSRRTPSIRRQGEIINSLTG